MNKTPNKNASTSRTTSTDNTTKELTKVETKLVHLDPLQRYLNDIGKYKLLTPEEEHDLAVEFQKDQDPQLAYKLVTANLRLVVKIAMEHRGYYQNLLDLIQEGNIGLMQAVKKFDPYRGVRLPSYAQWWIKAFILKFILENFSLVKIGTTQAQRKLFFRLKKEQEKLRNEGQEYNTRLLAERIDVPEKEIVEMEKRLSGPESSLESTHPNSGRTLLETMAGNSDNPETHAADSQILNRMREHMEDFSKTLHGRELKIWELRIACDEPVTFQEIGETLGITRQRVQQIEQKLKDSFKKFIGDNLPNHAMSGQY